MKPKIGKRRIVLSFVLVVALLALGLMAFRILRAMKKEAEWHETQAPLTHVHALRLEPEDYQEVFWGYGRVRALLDTVVSAEVQGVVVEVSPHLEAGCKVEADTILCRIDDQDYREALLRAEAVLAQNRAEKERQNAEVRGLEEQLKVASRELELSRAELQRRIEMHRNHVASPDEVDRQRRVTKTVELNTLRIENNLRLGRINATRMDAVIQAAEQGVQRARRDVERCVLRAPFSGVVESRSAQLGARVAVGTALFRVVNTQRVEIPVSLPASTFGDVEVGSTVSLFCGSEPKPRWECRVSRLAPLVDAAARTCLVYLVLESRDGRPAPPPGAFLKARVMGPLHHQVYVIPRTAILEDEVFALELQDDGKTARVTGLKLTVDHLLPDAVLSRDPKAASRIIALDNLEQIANGSMVHIEAVRSRSEGTAAR